MIAEEQLIAFQADALPANDRTRVEQELAQDPNALQMLLAQDQIEQQLRVLLGGPDASERIKRSILEVVSGPSFQRVKREVLCTVRSEERARNVSPWWRYGMAGLAVAACLAFVILLKSPDRPSRTVPRPRPGPLVLARDPARQPFAATSPWNHPIGSDAIFSDVDSPGLDLARGAFVFGSRMHRPVLQAAATDPIRSIFAEGDPAPFATVRVSPEVVSFPPGAPGLILIDEASRFAIELVGVRVTDDGGLQARACFRYDLRGSGISAGAPARLGQTPGGMPSLGGLIRAGELRGGISHALSVAVPRAALNRYRPFVWPAGGAPMIPQWLDGLGASGNVHLGTLLALPPTVDLATLGVGNAGPAYEIARALRDFGAYVTVTLEGSAYAGATSDLVFCTEAAAADEVPAGLGAQLAALARQLKVVANNAPDRVGGGGTPRRPLAQEVK